MTERSTPTRTPSEPRLRRTSQGDTLGARSIKGVAKQTARIRTNAAQGAQQAAVKQFLERSGQEGLPLILVDGEIALAGRYPRRAELARWAGISTLAVQVQPAADSCSGPACC